MKKRIAAFTLLLSICVTANAHGADFIRELLPQETVSQASPKSSSETSSGLRDSLSRLFGTDTSNGNPPKMEGDGFASPEEAAAAYIEGLQNNDIYQMLSAFAVETYAENFSLGRFVERIRAYSPTVEFIPSISERSLQLNIEERRSNIMDAIRAHYLVLTGSGVLFGEKVGAVIPLNDEYASADELVDSLFVSDDEPYFSQFHFDGEFVSPALLSPSYASENTQKNMKEQAAVVDADDMESVAAIFYSGNRAYFLGMDAAKFEDRWYLLNAGGYISALLNISSFQYGMAPLDDLEISEDWEAAETEGLSED